MFYNVVKTICLEDYLPLTNKYCENKGAGKIEYLSKIMLGLDFCINEVKLKKKERARLDERTNR